MMTFGFKAGLFKASWAAALMVLGAGPVWSQEGPQADFNAAVMALTARLGPTESGPAIPTTDAAANAADIAVIEQAVNALGSPAFPIDGIASFGAVCDPLNRLSVRHLLDGIAEMARPEGAPPMTQDELQTTMGKVQALQLRNVARHADAVTILSGSGVRCMVRHFPALATFLAALPPEQLTPTRLDGARQMRRGSVQVLTGFMMGLRDPATSPANKARLRAYVAEIAVPMAEALTPALRAEVNTAIARLPATEDADALATTALLQSALATTACEGLCRY